MTIRSLLLQAIEANATDLHIIVDAYPMIRIDSELKALPGSKILNPQQTQELVLAMMTEPQKELFLQNRELDFSLSLENGARFRVNAYYQKGCCSAAIRLFSQTIRSIEDLQLPQICYNFCALTSGLVLVTGPTGHGKTTTLASMIEEVNTSRFGHIVTIEDPIEYVYENKKCIVSQREVGQDTHSWKMALRSALREDPDVVLIGEMRDFETIAAALTIAETGHLVFATLHTNSASQTIDRIVDVFPAYQQNQVRMQLANTLEAVLSQRLLPSTSGGRVPVLELLLGTSAVKTNIREGKTHLLDNIIQTSQETGMISMENYMAELIYKGKLSLEVARAWSLRPNELMRLVKNVA